MLVPDRTLVIISGAGEWPHMTDLETSPAFAASATALRDYLTEPPVAVPDENLLWLFDAEGVDKQYARLIEFLSTSVDRLHAPNGQGVTVLFAYVGHGLFGSQNAYCLALRDTRKPIEAETSLRLEAVAEILRYEAPRSSRFLILDSCFAGAAARLLQGSDAAAAEARAAVEGQRGVALMCAASARKPALLDDAAGRTTFIGELVDVLREGDSASESDWTVRRLCDVVRERLRERLHDKAPLPEVHSPDQAGGDLTNVPLFPNAAEPDPANTRLTRNEAATLRAGRSDLIDQLSRAGWMIYGDRDGVTPAEIAEELERDGFLDALSARQAASLLALTEQELGDGGIARELSMQLIYFHNTVVKSLGSAAFEALVKKSLRRHGWIVDEVPDPHREERGWLPDLVASHGDRRILVVPKTATRTDSKLLPPALSRIERQLPRREVDAAFLVIPNASQTRAPHNDQVEILHFNDFEEAIADGGKRMVA